MAPQALGTFHRLPLEIREKIWDAYLDLSHINDIGFAGSKHNIRVLTTVTMAIRVDCIKIYDFHYWQQASMHLDLEVHRSKDEDTRYTFWLSAMDGTRIDASIASVRLASPDLRPTDPPPLSGLRHVRKLNICLRHDFVLSYHMDQVHTAHVLMVANALSNLQELFLDLDLKRIPYNRNRNWHSYVQRLLVPILRLGSLKQVHIDNGVAGADNMDIANFVEEVGCSLDRVAKWHYKGLIVVGKDGSKYWHGKTVQYTTAHDFDTEEERQLAEKNVGHYVFERLS